MRARWKLSIVLALATFVAGCEGPCSKIAPISGPVSSAGPVDFSVYCAAGTSISAGFQSGGLVDRHQVHSFTSIFAQRLGKVVTADGRGDFTFQSYNNDGLPPLLRILSVSPLIISRSGGVLGTAQNNPPAPFHNLGVPSAIAFEFLDSTFYYSPAIHPNATQYFNEIVRHSGTIAQQLIARGPTFVTWEYGANEVLGPATSGHAPSASTAANYAAIVTNSMNLIHGFLPNTKVAVCTVPDVTSIPYATTFSAFTISLTTGQPVPLIGPGGVPLAEGDFVLLNAANLLATGQGIPVGGYNYVNPGAPGTGAALPDSVVLDAGEAAATRAQIDGMNAVLDSVALRPYVAKVDFHGLLEDIATNGLRLGGNLYTTAYVTGGLFSLDGVHPNDLGQALFANELIDAVNARFGSSIADVNPLDWATVSASSLRPAPAPEGLPRALRIEGLSTGLITRAP